MLQRVGAEVILVPNTCNHKAMSSAPDGILNQMILSSWLYLPSAISDRDTTYKS